jgi:hypothetical protein
MYVYIYICSANRQLKTVVHTVTTLFSSINGQVLLNLDMQFCVRFSWQ